MFCLARCMESGVKPLTMRIFKALIILAIIGGAIAYWVHSNSEKVIDLSQPESGQSGPLFAADITVKNAKGQTVQLSSYKGKPIMLNFWATWCPPCQDELPTLLSLAEWSKKEAGVETLAVSVDQDWATIDKFFAEKKLWPRKELPLTIFLSNDGTAAAAYGTSKFPETYFIDRNFRIIRKFIGAQNWTSQEIMQWVKEHSK